MAKCFATFKQKGCGLLLFVGLLVGLKIWLLPHDDLEDIKVTQILASSEQKELARKRQDTTLNDTWYHKFMKEAKSFNLGQIMHQQDSYKKTDVILPKQCPEQYAFPKSIQQKFDGVAQVSNYSKMLINYNNTSREHSFQQKILILTPVSNYAFNMLHYFKLLCWLSYPHSQIEVVLGEDSSIDQTYRITSVHAAQLRQYFKNVSVLHFKDKMPENKFFGKHDEFFQFPRRSHLAKVRNQLLTSSLGHSDADVVLWLDADIQYIPPDLIQHLLYEDKHVIVPSCVFRKSSDEELQVYDRNTWQETENSLAYLKKLPSDQLRLEGYTKSMRKYLPDLKQQGYLVKLHGVGGCALMVQAQCHRKGLFFPSFVFDNHIETEGLAKMATKIGLDVYGLPYVNVVHW